VRTGGGPGHMHRRRSYRSPKFPNFTPDLSPWAKETNLKLGVGCTRGGVSRLPLAGAKA